MRFAAIPKLAAKVLRGGAARWWRGQWPVVAIAMLALLLASTGGCAGWQPRVVATMQYTVRSAALSHKAHQVDVEAKRIARDIAALPDVTPGMVPALVDAELARGRQRRAQVSAALVALAGLLEAWGDAYRAGAEPSLLDVVQAYCRAAQDYPEAGLPAPPARVACPSLGPLKLEER